MSKWVTVLVATLIGLVVVSVVLVKSSTDSQTFYFELTPEWEVAKKFDIYRKGNHFALEQKYHFGPGESTKDQEESIDIDFENSPVVGFIDYLKRVIKKEPQVFVVPGFMPPSREPIQLHSLAKMRLNSAVKKLRNHPGSIILVSGGNVQPKGTPFNEAIEMKRHLINYHRVPEFLVAVDPNAQNTVTNLRNAGRFLLFYGIKEAQVITTLVQNVYISFSGWTSFAKRSRKMLGYEVGEVQMLDTQSALFKPVPEVLQKSSSRLDP